MRRAADQLIDVLNVLSTCPFQPEIPAIAKDEFLKPVTSRQDVRDALDKFQWKAIEPGGIPALQLAAWTPQLWHFGVPLEARGSPGPTEMIERIKAGYLPSAEAWCRYSA